MPATYPPYRLSVEEYVTFRQQGFLVVRGLVPPEDVQEMNDHADAMLAGGIDIGRSIALSDKLSREEQFERWSRVHMLHRELPIHERFLLHPRILDVLEALIGPDVLALQSMLFLKQPGQDGQGYHQDAYYIPTLPDTLIGAWVAIDRADEENGCLWMTIGSQHEPIYPDVGGHAADRHSNLDDLGTISNASATDESRNGLLRVAKKYAGREVSAVVDPGDVVFFGGHILHRSHRNFSATRSRRSFVGHYCNARSLVPWNHGQPYEGTSGNYLHILARGSTHLPYAQPRFGTPCAANQPVQAAPAGVPMGMMAGDDDLMVATPHSMGSHTIGDHDDH